MRTGKEKGAVRVAQELLAQVLRRAPTDDVARHDVGDIDGLHGGARARLMCHGAPGSRACGWEGGGGGVGAGRARRTHLVSQMGKRSGAWRADEDESAPTRSAAPIERRNGGAACRVGTHQLATVALTRGLRPLSDERRGRQAQRRRRGVPITGRPPASGHRTGRATSVRSVEREASAEELEIVGDCETCATQ